MNAQSAQNGGVSVGRDDFGTPERTIFNMP
jgi:hypothetical protein